MGGGRGASCRHPAGIPGSGNRLLTGGASSRLYFCTQVVGALCPWGSDRITPRGQVTKGPLQTLESRQHEVPSGSG